MLNAKLSHLTPFIQTISQAIPQIPMKLFDPLVADLIMKMQMAAHLATAVNHTI